MRAATMMDMEIDFDDEDKKLVHKVGNGTQFF